MLVPAGNNGGGEEDSVSLVSSRFLSISKDF